MVTISYNKGCRNCFQTDGIGEMIPILDADENEYISKTEFEVMCIIEKWREEEDEICQFCNSTNVEVQDIRINNLPLFSKAVIEKKISDGSYKLIMFNIDKSLSEVSFNQGGNASSDSEFQKASLKFINEVIENRPENNFNSSPKGWFIISLTGKFNRQRDKFELSVERFKTIGMTKEEIYEAFTPLAERVGLKLPRNIKKQNDIRIPAGAFKGSLFVKWFYAESLDKDETYPYANACFDIDATTVMAIGTDPLSPGEFIKINQDNYFIIDADKKPLNKNGKVIHYVKRV